VSDVAEMAAKPLLSVRGLKVDFASRTGSIPAVRGVDFTVGRGEICAVIGESGSGKSTIAQALMGLLPATASVSGELRLDDVDLNALSKRARRRLAGEQIAMITQDALSGLNPCTTVGYQIAETLMVHRGTSKSAAMAEAGRLLEMTGIPSPRERVDDYPHQFSGGMRQRVMIAMALACRPKLLIADEPTTALDVTIQAQILALIRKLQAEENMSVLFITHDMGVVAEIADRTVVMYDGRAVETNTTDAIFADPRQPYTRALIAAVPRLGAMNGRERPMRFPVVDRSTGTSDAPAETPDTVKTDERAMLQVESLTTRFEIRTGILGRVRGRVHAVENVSFSLQAGETLSLVGESGCGKSTTGRSIMRLLEPLSGSVKLDGEDILKLDEKTLRDRRRNMQMIFQDPYASLNPRINIGDAIAEALLINRIAGGSEARDKVAELLAQVGLQPEMAGRYPHEFSGGQRQRVCIARALAVEPRLIVADESVSALDVSVKAQVVNLMLDLQARMGLGYLFISHDMAVVERVSHRVAVMYLGEIVEIGPRRAIFENPQHPYTKRLLAAVPIADPARRHGRRTISNDEIKSPIRRPDYTPPARNYREVSPGHRVMVWGDEWAARA